MRRGGLGLMAALVVLLAAAAVARADDAANIKRAQELAWQKQFAAAEQIYRQVLNHDPQSLPALRGLAQVLLWEGRYPEARRRFLALGDRLGAATAAYWQGDFRNAAREFRALPNEEFAQRSLAEIIAASRGTDRATIDWLHDDQPFHVLRGSATSSFFSDPLTRWDVTAGAASLSAPRVDRHRSLPFANVTNETVFPWQRLTLITTAGAQRYPDDSTGFVGALALREKTTATSSVTASIARRELLANATALQTHPFVTTASIAWQRYKDNSWIAGAETGTLRYFDHNRGRYSQAYLLVPVRRNIFAGISAAMRDTSDNRFYLEAVSGARSADGSFAYDYRGSFTPYWTPRDLREARAIVLITGTTAGAGWKLQLERGVSSDMATSFGPLSGGSPLPSGVFSFDFRRTSHPSRVALTAGWPVATRYRIECSAERNTSAFYAANSIHASLVRHR